MGQQIGAHDIEISSFVVLDKQGFHQIGVGDAETKHAREVEIANGLHFIHEGENRCNQIQHDRGKVDHSSRG